MKSAVLRTMIPRNSLGEDYIARAVESKLHGQRIIVRYL